MAEKGPFAGEKDVRERIWRVQATAAHFGGFGAFGAFGGFRGNGRNEYH